MQDNAPGRDTRGPALSLSAPLRVHRGQPVPVTVMVANHDPEPLELYLRGRKPTIDVVVRDSAGAIVWRLLDGEMIPAIIHVLVLRAGGEFSLRAVWNQVATDGSAVPPGRYRIRGELLVDRRESLPTNECVVEVADALDAGWSPNAFAPG